MVGIKEVHTVTIERTLFGAEIDSAARAKARTDAIQLAQSL
jgi:hypothetical protein